MVLSVEGVALHEPIYRFYSEEAKEDVKHGTCIVEGKSSTNNSPPERTPHEEYRGKDQAKARLLLPDSVRRLEDKIDSLIQIDQRFADSVGKLVDFFKQTAGVPKDQLLSLRNSIFSNYVR